MRHRKAGYKLDRHSQERIALFRNLTISLFEHYGTKREYILTSVTKAKAVRPFAERIITLGMKARKELDLAAKAAGVGSAEELLKQHVEGKKRFARSKPQSLDRRDPDFDKKKAQENAKKAANKKSDYSPEVQKHIANSLHFRRQVIERLRHEPSVRKLVNEIAPRFIKRQQDNPANQGGYTRVLRTSQWVLGDGSTKGLWGFVGGEGATGSSTPAASKGAMVGAK